MKKLILVRSGSSAWDDPSPEDGQSESSSEDNRRLQGTVPLPLSEVDMESLRTLADTLCDEGVNVFYNSGNESSGATAVYLAELCRVKIKELPNLRELDCGLWQGLRIKEIKQRFGKAYKQWCNDPSSVCPPQGEAIEDAEDRVSLALQKIYKKNKGKIVVIVVAPMVAALIECIITNSVDKDFVLPEDVSIVNADIDGNEIERPWCFGDPSKRMQVFEETAHDGYVERLTKTPEKPLSPVETKE